jgi:DNA-binding CsgD family transcriptional regulator
MGWINGADGAGAYRVTSSPAFEARLAEVVNTWSARYSLTPAERGVLLGAARGEPRCLIVEKMGCAPETMKKHCHNLLQKTGDERLLESVARLLREALT